MDDRFKFRAWDNDKKRMLHPVGYIKNAIITEEEFAINSDGVILGFPQAGLVKRRSNIIIMQCTGLKDKNGKLIFQGDIVNTHHDEIEGDWDQEPIEAFDSICIIEWDGDGYICHFIDQEWANKMANKKGFNLLSNNGIEALGNIYENPELLTKIQ